MGDTIMIDPAFKKVERNKACFMIWRIEKMEVVPVPKDKYGSFYKGDCYIVYSAIEKKGSLDMHIHFWIGEESSQDEQGTVAIKTIELDDYLGGAPVQHREVQEHESLNFKSLFKSRGIKYLNGGMASGFTKVKDLKFAPKMLWVKGKPNVVFKEVTTVGWASMNNGDCYVLETKDIIFVYKGKHANRYEELKAMELANKQRNGRPVIAVEDGEEDKCLDDEKAREVFNEILPLNSKKLQAAETAVSDEKWERPPVKLYRVRQDESRCSDQGGSLKVEEVAGAPLKKSHLDTNDSFIIDNAEFGIWAWIGKKASKTERREAMLNAAGFIKTKKYPNNTPVTRVIENAETPQFKALFKEWPVPQAGKAYSMNRIAKTVQTKFDAQTLHDNPAMASQSQMVDDGSGAKHVYRVERNDAGKYEKVAIPEKSIGFFYGGDSYLVHYEYNGGKNHLIYFWQGQKSTQDEKGASALLATEMDDELGGAAVQVRVVQGKEPPHFMRIFGGKMIIFSGGKAGWGKQGEEGPGDTYLLQVRGTSNLNCKAVQVPLTAESLNSNDVFVLFSKTAVHIWCGKGSTGDEREMAKQLASISPRSAEVIQETREKDDFWSILGGKKPYQSSPRLMEVENDHPPRLFQCSNASGRFTAQEIPEFTQLDLIQEDVMMLDSWDTIFLWIGKDSRPEEAKDAMTLAVDYLTKDTSGRDPETPICSFKQFNEPPTFIGFFGIWDAEMWGKQASLEDTKERIKKDNVKMQTVREIQEQGDSAVRKYPYEELIKKDDENPLEDVDPLSKEIHLTDEDFQRVFKMTFAEFSAMPVWKQKDLKKDKGLF